MNEAKETRNYLIMLLRQTKSEKAEEILKDLIDYLENKYLKKPKGKEILCIK
jgi:hypothetical protein